MTRGIRTVTFFTVLVAGVLLAAGCGSESTTCASETPTVNKQASTCDSMAAGQPVQVALQICPTCNQTDAECRVDLSGVASGIIHLDPLVHACDTSNSCPPSCSASPLTCTFTSPSDPGPYNMYVGDSTTPVEFTVGGADTSCAAGPG